MQLDCVHVASLYRHYYSPWNFFLDIEGPSVYVNQEYLSSGSMIKHALDSSLNKLYVDT